MGDRTKIEWSEATWNPVTGCDEVSPGCDNCYAKTFAERWRGTPGHYFERGFDVQLRPDKLDLPLRWRRPRRVFVNSMSDLFHQDVPDEYIARVFAVMALTPRHTFQVLTKRHARMRSLLGSGQRWAELVEDAFDWVVANLHAPMPGEDHDVAHAWATSRVLVTDSLTPLPNVCLVVSVEDQHWAEIRIPALLDTPAAVRGVSCEPLLGPVKLAGEWLAPPMLACWEPGYTPDRADAAALSELGRAATRRFAHDRGEPEPPYIGWVIAGGESGPRARPMHPDWARQLRDQCQAAGMPFFFKQWGEWALDGNGIRADVPAGTRQLRDSAKPQEFWLPGATDPQFTHTVMVRVGKQAAGRELDGRTWDEYPQEITT